MRILIALDGSAPSDRARELAAAIPWPAGSTIRLVSVVQQQFEMLAVPGLAATGAELQELEAPQIEASTAMLAEAAATLAGEGRQVETAVLIGRPASTIVDDATRFAADLVIAGSRGHGTLASMVLGSVSAEVVDHAPCPVLVARTAQVRKVMLAEDGSASAARALALVADWPIFAGSSVTVVSVSDVVLPWSLGMVPNLDVALLDTYDAAAEEDLAERRRLVSDAVARLKATGREAKGIVLKGYPSALLVDEAREQGADLVVLGSRGLTGLTRLVLGSVARNVLHHSPSSVLIVR